MLLVSDVVCSSRIEWHSAVTTSNYFWFLSPVGALARGTPDPSINMMHDKNNYADPYLKIGERSASFQDLKGETIHIEWEEWTDGPDHKS